MIFFVIIITDHCEFKKLISQVNVSASRSPVHEYSAIFSPEFRKHKVRISSTMFDRLHPDLYSALSSDRRSVNEADRCSCTPNRRVVERAMRDAHLLDIPYKCSSRSDYSFRLMRQPAFPPIPSLFFSFLQRRPLRQFCLVRRSADPQAG